MPEATTTITTDTVMPDGVKMTSTTTSPLPAPPKPGYQTTEFYFAAAAKALGILFASGLLGDGSLAMRIAGLAAAILAQLGYTVSRTLVKTAGVLLLVALTAAQVACSSAQRTATKTALVDCTVADAAALGATAGDMLKCPDWACVEQKAIAAGVQVGGCAFLRVIAAGAAPVGAAALMDDGGHAAFESYRARVAGGATFHTADGDR